jgi:NAD(P)-dependent dehydrogenase (short-subunit alcohol dehydrogenase family)
MNILDQKVLFITWGTSGIGKAAVIEAVWKWARVCFVWRNKDEAKLIVEQLAHDGFGDRVMYEYCDVTNVHSLQSAVNSCVDKFWQLDGVFANAGYHTVGNLLETTLEEWNKIISVDLTWTFLTLKITIPHMMERGWSVVVMWSDQTLIGKGNSCAYGVTKWAVGQLTKSTAIDFAQYGIRVNCVCPGTIDTPLAHRAMQLFADHDFWWDFQKWKEFLEKAQPIQRLGSPEEVSHLVCFLLSEESSFMTGWLISVDGGYVAQ